MFSWDVCVCLLIALRVHTSNSALNLRKAEILNIISGRHSGSSHIYCNAHFVVILFILILVLVSLKFSCKLVPQSQPCAFTGGNVYILRHFCV